MRSVLVIWLAIGCAACAAVPGSGPVREYTLDEVIPLRPDKSAEGSFASGPFAIVKVEVRQQPTAKEVALAKDRTFDTTRPRPIVTVRSTADHTARVSIVSIFEDASGNPLMVCKSRLDQELAPGFSEEWSTCQIEDMRTVHWPRVANLHVKFTFLVRDEPLAESRPASVVEGSEPAPCPGLPGPEGCK
jgi:hypothetical protein